jgi:hypothetical protein
VPDTAAKWNAPRLLGSSRLLRCARTRARALLCFALLLTLLVAARTAQLALPLNDDLTRAYRARSGATEYSLSGSLAIMAIVLGCAVTLRGGARRAPVLTVAASWVSILVSGLHDPSSFKWLVPMLALLNACVLIRHLLMASWRMNPRTASACYATCFVGWGIALVAWAPPIRSYLRQNDTKVPTVGVGWRWLGWALRCFSQVIRPPPRWLYIARFRTGDGSA